jgi:hypothetical protein
MASPPVGSGIGRAAWRGASGSTKGHDETHEEASDFAGAVGSEEWPIASLAVVGASSRGGEDSAGGHGAAPEGESGSEGLFG